MLELQPLETVTCMVSDLPALWESLLAYEILAQGAALEVGVVGYKACGFAVGNNHSKASVDIVRTSSQLVHGGIPGIPHRLHEVNTTDNLG